MKSKRKGRNHKKRKPILKSKVTRTKSKVLRPGSHDAIFFTNKAAKDCVQRTNMCCTYDNCYNTSNYVPPLNVLKLKLHPSFPILYLPEYISRRFKSLPNLSECGDEFQLPQDISSCYQSFLNHYSVLARRNNNDSKITIADAHLRRQANKSHCISSPQEKKLHEILVRMIIIPLQVGLISKVARPITIMNNECLQNHSPERKERSENKSHPCASNSSSTLRPVPEGLSLHPESQSRVVNYYLKRNKRKLHKATQSLQNLTDDTISSLVLQKKRYKKSHEQQKQRNYETKKNPEYNHYCYGMNTLSDGYTIATDRKMQHKKRRTRLNKNTNMIGSTLASNSVPHCANMHPGIQCTQPNSCASFARSSPVMKLLHRLIGDELMRELLLRCMILVPTLSCNGGFERGNYFQLSGPPLSMMNLNVRPEGFDHDALVNVSAYTSATSESKGCDNQSSPDPFWTIPRHRMFYSDSYVPRVGFPSRHVLNCSGGSSHKSAEAHLLSKIFKVLEPIKSKVTKRWKRVKLRGLDICDQIIRRHKKCDYHRVLDRYCPLPNLGDDRFGNNKLEFLIAKHSDSTKVISFFSSVLKKVFPLDFWGSIENYNVVLKGVGIFLTIRKKEQFAMKKIMKGIRILDINWLLHPSILKSGYKITHTDHQMATELLNHVMKWIYCDFLIPLVRSAFYCTDTAFTGNEMRYYRKPVWSKIKNLAMDELSHQFLLIKKKDTTKIINESSLACSGLRLLPKKEGIRPIALLCKQDYSISSSKFESRYKFSTNKRLRQTFDLLVHEHRQQPSLFGVGLCGLYEIHSRLLSYLRTIEILESEMYFVSVDIHRCYDNINQQYLLEILKQILSKDEYALQEHMVFHAHDKSPKVMEVKNKTVRATGDVVNFLQSNKALARNCRNAIFMDRVKCDVVQKSEIMDLVVEHLSRNLLVLKGETGPQLLRQKMGIPQGSIISSVLCNFYYGQIEEILLNDVFDEEQRSRHFLARLIDDFLLITTEKRIAHKFLTKLTEGSKELGVQINNSKTKSSHNFDDTSLEMPQGCQNKSTVKMNGNTYFPWCGFLFNTQNCEVQIDYRRFSDKKASDSLTINRVKNEGINFASKLQSFVRPRCIPILFDPRINLLSTVRFNFHQAMTLSAVKSMNYIYQGLDGGISQNAAFIEESILEAIIFARNLIHSNLQSKRNNPGIDEHDPKLEALNEVEALFLGLHAFEAVLQHFSCDDESASLALNLRRCKQKLQLSLRVAALSDVAAKALISFDLNSFKLS